MFLHSDERNARLADKGGRREPEDAELLTNERDTWVLLGAVLLVRDDCRGKRDAARRWANYVNADETVVVPWRYLLVSEADVDTAKGSWTALKKLGGE